MRTHVFAAVSAVLGILSIIYYTVCGFMYTFAMSGLWIFSSAGFLLIFAAFWMEYADKRLCAGKFSGPYRAARAVFISAVSVFIASFILFECILAVRWYGGTKWRGTLEKTHPDAVIVLGAAVEYDRPGATLRSRIDTAFEVWRVCPDSVIIACGGLGGEDIVTEADCIKSELVKMGVPDDLVITETNSASTSENFDGAMSLLPDGTERIAVVTSGFHIHRAMIIGRMALEESDMGNAELFPVSAPCGGLNLPCSIVREFAAVCRDMLSGKILF